MILKKPYAFILKHFRIIHLLLVIPMMYLVSETSNIVSFFSDYIENGYILGNEIILSNLASNYINILMYVAILIILFVAIFLTFVLQKKDKPTKFYNISIIYYLIIFALITLCFDVFKMIETDTLDDIAARFIRDFSFIVHYSQYIFIIFAFIRGIGFDIKHFNFKGDLLDLEISSEDNEEFEFLIGKDAYKTTRALRRFVREFKYYYKENKFVMIMIIIIILFLIGTTTYVNKEVYQKVYNEGEILSFGYLTFKIKDTYISKFSSNGETINEDKTYLIIQAEITNTYREEKEFNYNDLQVVINKKYISPSLTLANKFKDFGIPYAGTKIKGNTNNTYILVYEIDKYWVNDTFIIEAYSSYDSKPGGLGILNKRIEIKPYKLNDNILTTKVNKGTSIKLSNTNLKNTTLNIMNYNLTNRHEYNYQYCISIDNCYIYLDAITINYTGSGSKKTLLVLDYNLSLDNESPYMYSNKDYRTFFEDYMKIEYNINDSKKETYIKLRNPNNYSDKLVMEVPNEIEKAKNINAIITVRNESYIINLK